MIRRKCEICGTTYPANQEHKCEWKKGVEEVVPQILPISREMTEMACDFVKRVTPPLIVPGTFHLATEHTPEFIAKAVKFYEAHLASRREIMKRYRKRKKDQKNG